MNNNSKMNNNNNINNKNNNNKNNKNNNNNNNNNNSNNNSNSNSNSNSNNSNNITFFLPHMDMLREWSLPLLSSPCLTVMISGSDTTIIYPISLPPCSPPQPGPGIASTSSMPRIQILGTH